MPLLLVLTHLFFFPFFLDAQSLVATRPERAEAAADVAGGQDVAFEDGLTRQLLRVPLEKTVWVSDWPVAPGTFQEVALTRHDVYAPGARIYRLERGGPVEVPRSRQVFFWGGSADQEASLWLAIDPQTGEISGATELRGQSYRLQPKAGAAGRYTVAKAEAFAPEAGAPPAPGFACGGEQLKDLTGSALFERPAAKSSPFQAKELTSLHTAKVAVDTDNELLSAKFGDDTTRATDYIAQLFAAVNVMYERDLKVRLLETTTFLRVSSQPDPYLQATAGDADSSKLSEFGTYWKNHYNTVDRALALMLSGKQPGTTAASGVGYIDGLCNGSFGYSFNQVFRSPTSPAANDAKMVGHELGHNFGSDHTHCYSPPIDNCYSGEAGRGSCYAGTPSCPAATTINGVANVQGTVMSYCHLSPGGCTSSAVFHPRTVQVINEAMAPEVGLCILPAEGTAAGGGFYPLAPCRAIDTRTADGPRGGPGLAAASKRSFVLAGVCGIPADARAVAGNLTVISPEADGYLKAYAAGTNPSTSVINFRARQIKANNVVLPLPTDGSASEIFDNGSAGAAHFVLDVTGYFR